MGVNDLYRYSKKIRLNIGLHDLTSIMAGEVLNEIGC